MDIDTYFNLPKEDFKEITENLGDNIQKLAGKNILVLGGSGFLGSAIKKWLLYLNDFVFTPKQECLIFSIDNFTGRTPEDQIKDKNIIEIGLDIVKDQLPDKIKFDYILNCTGNAAPNAYQKYPEETMDVSYIGTQKVLKLAQEHNATLVNFSSSEVLGTPDTSDIPTKETVIPKIASDTLRSPYDVGKLALETLSWIYNKKGVNVKVIRLFNCIGYFGKHDFRVIPNFLYGVLRGEKMKVYEPANQTRTFSFYTDVITGIFLVLLNGKDFIYHIGNQDEEITILELAEKVQSTLGLKDSIKIIPSPDVYKTEPLRRCPDITKANKELGFSCKVNLENMIKRIYNWSLHQNK